MTEVTVHIEGLSELKTTLRELLPDRTARNVMKRVLLQVAQPVAAAAEGLAPRRTGQLQRSIVATTKLTRRQRAMHRKRDPNDAEAFIGAGNMPQAHLREYGADHHPAQPFLRPAWDLHKRAVLEGIKTAMWREIEKSVQRLNRKRAKAGG
jgi:HK97 gp10 family phage protein